MLNKIVSVSFIISLFATVAMAAPPSLNRLHKAYLDGNVADLPRLIMEDNPYNRTWVGEGNQKTLAILVDFNDNPQNRFGCADSDYVVPQNLRAYFEELLFGDDELEQGLYHNISVAQFYEEVSGGLLTFSGAVTGPFLLEREAMFYGAGNGISVPSGETTNRAYQMVEEAILMAEESGFDFAPFDADDDGVIDNLIVVHAGYGGEDAPYESDEHPDCSLQEDKIWSHFYNQDDFSELDDIFPPIDIPGGYSVRHYSVTAENVFHLNDLLMTNIGITVHELGHSIGMPDLYDRGEYDDESGATNKFSTGLGVFDFMSYGCLGKFGENPSHPSAWMKLKQGWTAPRLVTETTCSVVLNPIQEGGDVLQLWRPGEAIGDEYFLVSYRPLIGTDVNIPCGGIMIYHVDEKKATDEGGNIYNDYPCQQLATEPCPYHHYLVALEQADGQFNLDGGQDDNLGVNYGDSGDCYQQGYIFDSSTSPNSNDYQNNNTRITMQVKYTGPATAEVVIVYNTTGFPMPPLISTKYVLTHTIGKAYSQPLIISGLGPLVWDLKSAPEGMRINEDNLVLYWPAEYVTLGIHQVTYSVSNCAGSDEETYSFRVIEVDDDDPDGCGCNFSATDTGDPLFTTLMIGLVLLMLVRRSRRAGAKKIFGVK
jgi:M6 family metalloprotease-like protein